MVGEQRQVRVVVGVESSDVLPIALEPVRVHRFAALDEARQQIAAEVVTGVGSLGILDQPLRERGAIEQVHAHRRQA